MTSFLWGAATSAHQVEGGNRNNDWWAWESSVPGRVKSGAATDHYHRFAEDFALAQSLGHNAHRLSIEWSRCQLTPDYWSDKAFAHYREVLQALRDRGLTSFVTLHHFTNPQWFVERGGWQSPRAPEFFSIYARKVARELGDLVDYWVTINEPMVYATQSFWARRWPPQQRSAVALWSVIRNLARAHQRAYHALHDELTDPKVGLAKHVVAYMPANPLHWADRLVADSADWWFNRRFMSLTRGTHDFLGLNYYFSSRMHLKVWPPRLERTPWSGPVSDLNWPLDPAGFQHALEAMASYGLPIYVTENGLADAADSHRSDFLREHIAALMRARQHGADIRGYFHWSLLDNFEWAEGYAPRFGLVAVDYDTLERTPRKSAYVYKALIERYADELDSNE